MQPYAPFSGVLMLPDRAVFGKVSEVTLGTGEPVASIRWHPWTARARFDILDPSGVEVAQGGRDGVFGRRYSVQGRDGQAAGGRRRRISDGEWHGVSFRHEVFVRAQRCAS